jgi:hypothetical protein
MRLPKWLRKTGRAVDTSGRAYWLWEVLKWTWQGGLSAALGLIVGLASGLSLGWAIALGLLVASLALAAVHLLLERHSRQAGNQADHEDDQLPKPYVHQTRAIITGVSREPAPSPPEPSNSAIGAVKIQIQEGERLSSILRHGSPPPSPVLDPEPHYRMWVNQTVEALTKYAPEYVDRFRNAERPEPLSARDAVMRAAFYNQAFADRIDLKVEALKVILEHLEQDDSRQP